MSTTQRTLYAKCSDKLEHEETPGFQNLCCVLPSLQCSWDRDLPHT